MRSIVSLSLPHRPSIQHLKQQAKDLRRQLLSSAHPIGLQQAQQRLAQLYGFPSWTRLCQRVVQLHAAEQHARSFAFIPLGQMESVRGRILIPLLCEGMLLHPNPDVRALCAGLMDHFGTDAAVPALLQAVKDPVPRVRIAALHSLSCQRCKASALCVDQVEIFLHGIADVSLRIRRGAACGLSSFIQDERAMLALDRAFVDPRNASGDLRFFCIDAFVRLAGSPWKHRGIDAIARLMMTATDAGLRRWRGRAIAGLGAALPEPRALVCLQEIVAREDAQSASWHQARRLLVQATGAGGR